jgi:hypothetical protein
MCNDSIDFRGDINLNGIANEIADWVVYNLFFLFGLDAFEIAPAAQIDASDVNNDDEPLTIRDLAYIWRIIIGDALPYPKSSGEVLADTAILTQDADAGEVSLTFPDSLVNLFMLFSGQIQPETGDSTILLQSVQATGHTRVLVSTAWPQQYPPVHAGIFSGLLFTYSGEGELVTVDVGDWHDNVVPTRIDVVGGASACGDANGSSVIDITDVVFLVEYIFSNGAAPDPLSQGDADCNGVINISDVIALVSFIFDAGAPPCNDCP